MSITNTNTNSNLTMAHELPVRIADRIVLPGDQDSTWVDSPRSILQSAMAALDDGRVAEVVARFDEQFKFNDHGLGLEFTEKARLTEFFEKSRELFPDTVLEVISLFEKPDHAIAEWKLTATQTLSYASIKFRIPIDIPGCTIVRVENAKIAQWSDYYDQSSSRRMNLAGFFTEWVEY